VRWALLLADAQSCGTWDRAQGPPSVQRKGTTRRVSGTLVSLAWLQEERRNESSPPEDAPGAQALLVARLNGLLLQELDIQA
jgi:hypothetical protein